MRSASRAITRAIIPAAGYGSRLVAGKAYPKPLAPVRGTPLIVHVLRGLEAAGVDEVLVITGYLGDLLEEALRSTAHRARLRFVRNPDYDKPNGTSVLAARAYVEGPTLLAMSDHLVHPRLVEAVARTPLGRSGALLAVDTCIDACFDLDDATKVQLDGDRVRAIGKELARYDALDTGVFAITPAFMDALLASDGPGGCSISDAVRALVARGAMRTVDVSGLPWLDVDTPDAHAEALRRLADFGPATRVQPVLH